MTTPSKRVAEKLKKYFLSLPDTLKSRYISKISLINHFDPYSFEAKDFNILPEELPVLGLMEIVIYFAVTNSFYTGEQVRAYKSLESFSYCEAGFVANIKCAKINDNYLILCEVKHSQRINDDSLWPWLIINTDGSILTAHCTCMAGLGEVCSHAAAVAFSLLPRYDDASCTELLCTWNVPAFNKSVEPKRIKDMYWGNPIKSYMPTKKLIPPLQGDKLLNFLHKVNQYQPDASILRVIQPFASLKAQESIPNLPLLLSSIYNSEHAKLSLIELRAIQVPIVINRDEQLAVIKVTTRQSQCRLWYKFREGRITASMFKKACVTSIEKPSITTVKAICYASAKLNLKIESLQYGIKKEVKAKSEYFSYMTKLHTDFHIFPSGFVISVEKSEFGASSDALVECKCCGRGCVEVKCPFRMHQSSLNIEEFSSLTGSYLIKCDGGYTLDTSSEYFYQIQMQMYCTERVYCDFVVWSKNEMFVQRIYRDDSFLNEKLTVASSFYKNVIIPELLSKCYTQIKESVHIELWCHCLKPEDGRDMIKCSNDLCKTVWFHLDCVDAEVEEEFSWTCQLCCKDTLPSIDDSMEWD